MAGKEEVEVVTAAKGEAVTVEVMVVVGVGLAEGVVDMVGALGEGVALEVMVAAEGTVIVEVGVEMVHGIGNLIPRSWRVSSLPFRTGDEILILTHSKNMPALQEPWHPQSAQEELAGAG